MKKQFKWMVVIAAALALSAMMCACEVTNREPSTETEKQEATPQVQENIKKEQTEEKQEQPVEDKYMEIDTPYTTLFYPEQWKDYLQVETEEGDIYVVSFLADLENDSKQLLFKLSFGEKLENEFGSIQTKDGKNVDVAIEFAPSDENSSDVFLSMQEAANELLNKLSVSREAEVVIAEDLVIETPYGNLYYPGEWKDSLVVEQENESVHFYANINEKKVKLFTLEFGVEDSAIAYVLNDNNNKVSVGIRMEELMLDDNWSDEDKNTVYTMQESVNDLLEKLELANSK